MDADGNDYGLFMDESLASLVDTETPEKSMENKVESGPSSFEPLLDTATPEKRIEPNLDEVNFTPDTAKKIITHLSEDHDALRDFVALEAAFTGPPSSGVVDSALQEQLVEKEAALQILQTENESLKTEVKQCKDALQQQQRESRLEIYRLEREMESKNLDIASLRKETRDQEALIARMGLKGAISQKELYEEISDDLRAQLKKSEEALHESTATAENLRQLLQIQTERADSLSAAYAETLESFQEMSQEVQQIIDDLQSEEFCLPAAAAEFEDIDSPVLEELELLKNIELPTLDLPEDEIAPDVDFSDLLVRASANLGSHCRDVVGKWLSDLTDSLSTLEKYDSELNEMSCLCESLASQVLADKKVARDNCVDMKKRSEELQQELSKLREENAKLCENLEVLNENILNQTEKLEKLGEDNVALEDSLKSAKDRLTKMEAENANLMAQGEKAIDERIQQLTEENAVLSESSKESLSGLSKLESEKASMSENMTKLTEEYKESLNALNERIQTLTENNSKLTESLESAKESLSELSNLQSEIATLSENNNVLNERIQVLTENNSGLTESVKESVAELTNVKTANVTLSETIHELNVNIAKNSEEYKESLNNLDAKVETLTKENATLSETIQELNDMTAKKSEEYEQSLNILNAKTETLTEENAALSKTIQELNDMAAKKSEEYKESLNKLNERVENLTKENAELTESLNNAKQSLLEAESQRNELEESTCEFVSDLKDSMGEKFVSKLMEEEYDQFLSVKSEPELNVSLYVSMDEDVSPMKAKEEVEADTESLSSFAKYFAIFLVDKQVMHPDDVPPEDSNVFWYLLDRYLLLVDTYHDLKTEFEKYVEELETQQEAAKKKTNMVLNQLSHLELSTNSSLNSSATVTSNFEFGQSMLGNESNLTLMNDLTHDPLQITMDPLATPVAQRSRQSLNGSRIPTVTKPLPASTPRTAVGSTSKTTTAATPKMSAMKNSRRLEFSLLDSTLTSLREDGPSTPVQRVLRNEPLSTAKKSVTFRSPLLARTGVEAENTRLKALLDEKVSEALRLQSSVESRLMIVENLETRVAELEEMVRESRKAFEEAGNEYEEKRGTLEKELTDVKEEMSQLTDKLVLETIQLNPDLKGTLQSLTPVQILATLLETIIARFESTQAEERETFENERRALKDTISLEESKSQALFEKLKEQAQNTELSSKIESLEARLSQLSESSSKLESEKANLQEQVELKASQLSLVEEDFETLKKTVEALNEEKRVLEAKSEEIESLKLSLENCEKEKNSLQEQVDALQRELEQKTTQLDSVEENFDLMKKTVGLLNEQISALNEEKRELQAKVVESEVIESLKLALDNSEKEKNSLQEQFEALDKEFQQKTSRLNSVEKNFDELKKMVELLNEQISVLNEEKRVLEAKVVESGAIESLKLALENSEKEKSTLKEQVENLSGVAENLNIVSDQKSDLEAKIESINSDLENVKAAKLALEEQLSVAFEALKEVAAEFTDSFADNLIAGIKQVQKLVQTRINELVESKNHADTLVESLRLEIAEVVKQGSEEIKSLVVVVEEREKVKMDLEKTEEAVGKLTGDIEKLREDKETLLASVERGAEDNKALKSELEEQTNKNEQEVKQLNCQLEEKNEKLKESAEESAKKSSLIFELEASLVNKDQSLALLKADVESLTAEIPKLKEEIHSLTSLTQVLNKELQENATIFAEMKGLKEDKCIELDTLRAKMDAMQSEMKDLNEDKVWLEEQFQGVLEERDVAAVQVEDLTEDKQRLENQLLVAYQENDGKVAIEEVLRLQNVVKEKEALINSKIGEIEAMRVEMERLEAEKSDLVTLMNEQKEAMVVYENDIRVLKEETETTVKQLRGQLCDSENALKELQTVIAELENSKQTESLELVESLNQEISQLKEELTSLQATHQALQKEKEAVAEELSTALKNNTEVESCLKEELSSHKEQLLAVQKKKETVAQELSTALNNNAEVQAFLKDVEQQLRNSEARLVAAETRNTEFVEELQLLKDELISNKTIIEKLSHQLEELTEIRNELRKEKKLLEGEVKQLTESSEAVRAEKENLAGKLSSADEKIIQLNETVAESGKQIEELLQSSQVLKTEKSELASVIDILTKSRDICQTEKDDLATKLKTANSEIFGLKESLGEFEDVKTKLGLYSKQLSDLQTENEILTKKLKLADTQISELKESVSQYKSTEFAILSKLEEKQVSDENAKRLQGELSLLAEELATLKSQSAKQIQLLNDEVTRLQVELESLAQINADLTNKTISLEKMVDHVRELEDKISENDQQVRLLSDKDVEVSKLGKDKGELVGLLKEIQKTLGLPEESVLNLSTDANTRSYLRMFKDNVHKTEEQIDDLKKQKNVMESEQERLNIEIEKVSSEKVHLEIKMREFDELNRADGEKISALTNKLAKLEASMSRRSRRSDPIGGRRLDKLEEMNGTLHALLTQLLVAMEMPNAGQMRLISQREIEGATKSIIDYATKLAKAQAAMLTLQEEVKNMDQENQELSDNFEKQLEEISRLETKILELEGNNKSVLTCKSCSDVKLALKKKNDEVVKLNEKISDLETRIAELDQENDAMCNDMESLNKEKNELELKLSSQTGTAKDCSTCKKLRKSVNSLEDEIAGLKASRDQNADNIQTLEENLKELKKKSATLEKTLASTEKQLYRALNSRAPTATEPSSGVSGGFATDIDKNHKIQKLTKDNKYLKDVLRQRALSVKKLEEELTEIKMGGKRFDNNTSLHTNSMDSPIREKNYNLRNRLDGPTAPKRALRHKADGVENLRL